MTKRKLFLTIAGLFLMAAGGCKPQKITDILPEEIKDFTQTSLSLADDSEEVDSLLGNDDGTLAWEYDLAVAAMAKYEIFSGKEKLAAPPDTAGKVVTVDAATGNPQYIVTACKFTSPDDAFGMYSRLRHGIDKTIQLGAQGFIRDGKITFYKGIFVVHLECSAKTSQSFTEISKLAKLIADKTRKKKLTIDYVRWIPADNMTPFSLRYYRQNFLNIPEFSQTLAANYESKGKNYQSFICRYENKIAAAVSFDQLKTTIKGAKYSTSTSPANLEFTLPDNGIVTILHVGQYIVGTTYGRTATALTVADNIQTYIRRQRLQDEFDSLDPYDPFDPYNPWSYPRWTYDANPYPYYWGPSRYYWR